MRVLVGGSWNDGFLDYARHGDEYRVQVLAARNLEFLRDMYVVRRSSPRMVWNYVREVGPRAVWLRVRSRRGERGRNEKYVSIGVGRVLEAPGGAAAAPGALVAFLAPSHPACAERLVLAAELVLPLDADPAGARAGEVLHLPAEADPGPDARWWQALRGWTRHSGIVLDGAACRALLERAAAELRAAPWDGAARLPLPSPSPVAERTEAGASGGDGRRTAILFGYGNYAKVTSLPHLRRHLRVTAIHEADPTQLPRDRDAAVAWDTAPWMRPEERADAFLLAGYHHTHAPLAVEALRRGAYAVVEKPICTTHAQLDELLAALQGNPKLFACFHKRYAPFNEHTLADLAVRPGEPVNYHCVVYEIPLPELHWYRWPSSRSRLVSNGCHWLDHFLFVNGFSEPAWWDVVMGADETMNVSVSLRNGAFMTMTLTDQGSERIGLQEHVEMRANRRTVRIFNSSEYVAESDERILRRARANKLDGYARMYRTISRAVAEGRPGDTVDSVRVSTRLVLDLESRLAENFHAGRAAPPAAGAGGGR